jgi:esterase/lipase superfamily enzyme
MDLNEEYHKWYSPIIGRDFEMLVFGHAGFPVILFPTSKGSYYQNKDQGLIETARWFLENGRIKIAPYQRAHNQNLYDSLVLDEISSRARHETGHSRIATAGCSFGGYHAANFAFRHPGVAAYCFSMSGVFDIRSFADSHYDDTVYYNNPVDYLPDANDPDLWKMGIVLGTTDSDSCRPQNEQLSGILSRKNIGHWLDIRPNRAHDWPVWKEMFPHYLSLLPGTSA